MPQHTSQPLATLFAYFCLVLPFKAALCRGSRFPSGVAGICDSMQCSQWQSSLLMLPHGVFCCFSGMPSVSKAAFLQGCLLCLLLPSRLTLCGPSCSPLGLPTLFTAAFQAYPLWAKLLPFNTAYCAYCCLSCMSFVGKAGSFQNCLHCLLLPVRRPS